MKIKNVVAIIVALFFLQSCFTGIPEGAQPIKNFNAEKYLGQWYEIARLDHRFERNMNQVTANYSKKDNGHIKVVNRGYETTKKEWKESVGEARFVGEPNVGRLKVSFFKPIWGSYNIIELIDYKYALVVGNNTNYLWILSREKTIPEDVKQKFLNKAESLGFKTNELIWVQQ